jgi:electron transport complex protein RnfB
MQTILASIAVISGLAALFGFGLAYASKRLAVAKDALVEDLEGVLPGVNCGACGYPGCSGYAEALAVEKISPELCAPGGSSVAKRLGELLGMAVSDQKKRTARIYCGGDDLLSKHKLRYNGVADCVSAAALFAGFLECKDGCLGLGSCVRVCRFDAITIDGNGRTTIDPALCTGCGACVKACPHKLIELVPETSYVTVACSSHEKGAVCNKFCKVSCIACLRCEKACPHDAIHVVDFLARIDYEKCTSCGECVKVCPKKCIIELPGKPAPVPVAQPVA